MRHLDSHGRRLTLDRPHIVLGPILLRHLLLPNRHTLPLHSHCRHRVDVILVKSDAQCREVTFRPLLEPPFLRDVFRLVQLCVLAAHIPYQVISDALSAGL